jgi:DNA-binding transcriptional regulator YdaS (Cro superfamily)
MQSGCERDVSGRALHSPTACFETSPSAASLEVAMTQMFRDGDDAQSIRRWAIEKASEYGILEYVRPELDWRLVRAKRNAMQTSPQEA